MTKPMGRPQFDPQHMLVTITDGEGLELLVTSSVGGVVSNGKKFEHLPFELLIDPDDEDLPVVIIDDHLGVAAKFLRTAKKVNFKIELAPESDPDTTLTGYMLEAVRATGWNGKTFLELAPLSEIQ